VKNNVAIEWERTINLFFDVLEEDVSPSSVSRNYLQELNFYLHLSGIHTVQVLRDGASKLFNLEAATHLSSWDNVPPVLCITFEIPRGKLKALKDMPLSTLGTLSFCCTVQSSRTSPRQWSNNFTAVQMAFGHIITVGSKSDADICIDVKEDPYSWGGKPPLIVSFFIPTWIVVQELRTALVACGLQSTPHATVSFAKTLGLELRIFETTIGDDRKVRITNTCHICLHTRYLSQVALIWNAPRLAPRLLSAARSQQMWPQMEDRSPV
jgi:hypothetical protein